MTTPTDKELIALLYSSRPQDKTAFEQYLDSLPSATANDTLHRLASQVVTRGVRTGPIGWCLCAVLLIALIYTTVSEVREGKTVSSIIGGNFMLYLSFFSLLHTVLTQPKNQKKNEALLLLAARNDSRALPLLISEWRMYPSQKLRDWNEHVETEATRLLDENQSGTTSVEWQTMRKVVEKVIEPFQPALLRGRKDITLGQAYFVAAILRILSRAGGIENKVLLKKVAASTSDAKQFPNRTLVIEVAAVYQDDAKPQALLTTVTPTTTSSAVNPVQTLYRS